MSVVGAVVSEKQSLTVLKGAGMVSVPGAVVSGKYSLTVFEGAGTVRRAVLTSSPALRRTWPSTPPTAMTPASQTATCHGCAPP